jgi:hypothetical protein
LRTELGKNAPDGTLAGGGASGEDDAWRWVGTGVRVDRYRSGRQIGHDADLPRLRQRGSAANTNDGTFDRNRRHRDLCVVMTDADE